MSIAVPNIPEKYQLATFGYLLCLFCAKQMSSLEDWVCNYLVASLFILDLLHCAPKSICQIQFVHKMEAGQKRVAIVKDTLTFGQVLHLDKCYIRTSVTFENVSDLDKCYIWTNSDAIQWKSGIPACTLRRHIGMEVTQQLGFARIQPALSCSALALKCARTLCAINGRDQNAMHYIEARKLSWSTSFHQPVGCPGTGQWRLYCDWIAWIAPQLSSNGFQIAQTSSGWQFSLSLSGLQFQKCAATPITGLPQ